MVWPSDFRVPSDIGFHCYCSWFCNSSLCAIFVYLLLQIHEFCLNEPVCVTLYISECSCFFLFQKNALYMHKYYIKHACKLSIPFTAHYMYKKLLSTHSCFYSFFIYHNFFQVFDIYFYFYTKFISNKLIKYKLMLLSIWSILL